MTVEKYAFGIFGSTCVAQHAHNKKKKNKINSGYFGLDKPTVVLNQFLRIRLFT